MRTEVCLISKVKKFKAKIYNNAGWSSDLSRAVVERAMTHVDSIYRFESMHIEGFMCKTNTNIGLL